MTTSHGKVIYLSTFWQRLGIKWDVLCGWLLILSVCAGFWWLLIALMRKGRV